MTRHSLKLVLRRGSASMALPAAFTCTSAGRVTVGQTSSLLFKVESSDCRHPGIYHGLVAMPSSCTSDAWTVLGLVRGIAAFSGCTELCGYVH